MSLDDKLAQKNNDLINRKNRWVDEDDEEDVETYMYDVRKPMAFINEESSGVFDIRKQTGINTAKSVFDSKASFHTSG